MGPSEIASLVAERALRFGAHNPQQFRQLCLRLGRAAEVEVASGLLQVFTDGVPPPEGTASQELAGKLLAALCPRAEFDLKRVLRAALPRYELSVEQFPHYLRSVFGEEQVSTVLSEIQQEPLSAQEQRALRTFRFWLRNE